MTVTYAVGYTTLQNHPNETFIDVLQKDNNTGLFTPIFECHEVPGIASDATHDQILEAVEKELDDISFKPAGVWKQVQPEFPSHSESDTENATPLVMHNYTAPGAKVR
ncbi:hypothetical protein [Rhodococcus sp. NPDC055024]